jgi:hypothetical protein
MHPSITNGNCHSSCGRPERVERRWRDLIGAIGLASLLVCWTGCSSPPAAEPQSPAPAATEPPPEAAEPPPEATETERQELTSEQCEAQSGEVVGDIGDGATRRPGYLCPSGKPPTGNIAPAEGGPMPIEGAVCCPR